MENTQPLLQMKKITKRFPGVLAIDQVDLDLFPGEVLALLGENGAGKSTLMNILIGLYRPDEGSITLKGRKVAIHSPSDSANYGIGMVHQEFMLVDTMPVAENIILGMEGLPLVPSMSEVCDKIDEISQQYGLQINPRAPIWQLGVGERQRVEILKLIYRGADILILDEPTAVLTPQESRDLNRVVDQMRSEGKSAIFITHKMDEVMSFSDRVCVLQRGKLTATKLIAETDPQDLARLMVGKDVVLDAKKTECTPGSAVLSVSGVSALNAKGHLALKEVSFDICGGEILGFAGVAGNGQQEIVEAVTGLTKLVAGTVKMRGRDFTGKKPLDFINAGVGHIPADRLGMGVAGTMTVAENLIMKGYSKAPMSQKGLLKKGPIGNFAKEMIDLFNIATPGPGTVVKFLSGGNIQKCILAREIDACGDLLIAAYPLRGLDVGAADAVRTRIIEQRDLGKAVLLISEELEELMMVADRIAVMFEGRIMGVVYPTETSVEELGLMMTGVELDHAHQV